MPEFPPSLPADDIRRVLPEVYVVTGQMSVGEGHDEMLFSRNMTILREGSALTLINTLRLGDAGLAQLDELGTVEHVVRLGFHHGRDDAFYLDRYTPEFWAAPAMTFSRGESVTMPLVAGGPAPCTGASVFVFETSSKPEVILHLAAHGGLLVACDSLQNLTSPNAFFNDKAIATMQAGGFFRPANIGPGWRAKTAPEAADFARLLRIEFRHLLSAHGDPLLDTAYEDLSATIRAEFGI